MKKITLLIIVLLSAFCLTAQQWGTKAGVTFSHMNLDIPERYSHSVNYGGHIEFYINIGKKELSFQPEIMFIQKGVIIRDDLSENYMKVKSNYVDIPLLARSTVEMNDNVNLYFHFGPYLGILLNYRYDTKEIKDLEFELREGLLDAGIVMSAGIEVKKFIFELRACTGLVNMAEKTDDLYYDSRNNYVNVSIGYIIKN